ncbi:anaerobic ribonucleoside-triphosphate reductase activating protein [Patescibacteria group bacterium]|nr:anaerobic ribonucleoside-triphosphate reductase activating protein [Patescibacteria group bacterium]
MIISGLQKTTLIDYPDKIAAVVFTRGCNFKCPFCHNPELVNPDKYYPEMPEQEILDYLEKRKNVLDGVVITGGEPLIYSDIENFIRKVKAMGYKIKLDSNGTNPKLLEDLIDKKLVDFVAMDIKNYLDKYDETTGVKVNKDNIKKSIDIIMKKAPDYEFRTTVLPRLHKKEDFKKMGELIKGAKQYYIQGFRPIKTLDPEYAKEDSYTEKELEEFKEIMAGYVDKCEIRGII